MMPSEHTIQSHSEPEPGVVGAIGWRSRIAQHFEISTLLRLFGGGLTVMAIMMFLFQRWDDATDLLRYGMIMGETLTLTILGLATSLWLKEQKSARVFLGLSLVSTSAVYTILSAMIYSQVQWLPADANLPDYALWVADSFNSVLWLLAGSLIVLGGQSLFSLSVLARPVARRLTLLLMLNVALLLLPIRDMGITTLLVLPTLMIGFRYLSTLRKSTPAMRTAEGMIANLLVMLPLFIMIGRGAYLYAEDAMAFGTLALLTYLLLRQLALSLTVMTRLRRSLEVVSLLPALFAAFNFTQLLDGMVPQIDHWLLVVFGFLLSGFLLDLTKRAVSGGNRYFLAIFYTGLAVSAIEATIWPGVTTALFSTTLSGLILLYGYSAKENNLLRFSLLTLVGSFVLLVSELFVSFDVGIWISLALLGMSIIVLAAAVERYGDRMRAFVQRLKS
jgi:hypothetical protein